MITNPSTAGIFDAKIIEIAEIVHAAGAKLYLDGANMNALLGRVRPGEFGTDAYTTGTPDHPDVQPVVKEADTRVPLIFGEGWHTDSPFLARPPSISLLFGAEVPPYGGDTQWTNLVAAYNGLSETLRGFIDGLRRIHRFAAPQGVQTTGEYDKLLTSRGQVSEHPLVRVHPETGERALYISPSFLKSVVGLHPRESQQLLELLWEHAVRPDYTVRFRWQPGDIAFWDNRSTCHLAPSDIFQSDADRQLYRVTLVGDVPVGVDGRRSTMIEGEPVLAYSAA